MRQQAQATPMRVCIFSNDKSSCENLVLQATRANYIIAGQFNELEGFKDFISSSLLDHIILIDVSDYSSKSLEIIKELCIKRPLPIIIVANRSDNNLIARAVEAGAQVVLVKPVSLEDVAVAFSVAVHQQAKQARLESELDRLRAKLEERKLIERAKGILMDSAGVGETEAFQLLQKESQNKRRSMVEIARGIISTTELMQHSVREKGRKTSAE